MSNELTVIDNAISAAASQFVTTISQYKWELIPDAQLHAAKGALTKNPYITKIACQDVEAVHDALIRSAILGLDLTEGKRQGWLLPRKNANGKTVIQLQVGYKGVEAIHQRLGVIDRLVIRTVYENDVFEWSGDDQEKPKHEANWFGRVEDRGAVKGAFAITYYPDGSIHVVLAPISEIYEKHRNRSDSWKAYVRDLEAHNKDPKNNKAPFAPPWVTDERMMIEKTMAYIASKQWPANIRNKDASSKILETLHEIDISDYSERYTQEQKKWYYSFIEKDDALGMYLFERYVEMEVSTALFNSFPKGEKVKNKDKVRQLTKTGGDVYDEIIMNLGADDMAVLECIEGVSSVTVNMLKKQLPEEKAQHLETVLSGTLKAENE